MQPEWHRPPLASWRARTSFRQLLPPTPVLRSGAGQTRGGPWGSGGEEDHQTTPDREAPRLQVGPPPPASVCQPLTVPAILILRKSPRQGGRGRGGGGTDLSLGQSPRPTPCPPVPQLEATLGRCHPPLRPLELFSCVSSPLVLATAKLPGGASCCTQLEAFMTSRRWATGPATTPHGSDLTALLCGPDLDQSSSATGDTAPSLGEGGRALPARRGRGMSKPLTPRDVDPRRGRARSAPAIRDHRASVHCNVRMRAPTRHIGSAPRQAAQGAQAREGLPGRGGGSATSRPRGRGTRLQATHKGFLNSLSWPTVISINA